ncbi:MAG: GNAT family N-acetyltransferase [Phycisphaerae bacterium]|nr:GNAT family N-acetyltransferase [Phycisphaerae bacterium]
MNGIRMETPIGKLTIVAAGEYITNVFHGDMPGICDVSDFAGHHNATTQVLHRAAMQLLEYFTGERRTFDVPLKPAGGEFFQRVWATMQRELLYGMTISYSALAALAGHPKAARAVGMANHRNPIPILIPCHRVLGKNGALTGFRSGLKNKETLLRLEQQFAEKRPRVSLRHYHENDGEFLARNFYTGKTREEILVMIGAWHTSTYEGSYFEMFAIQTDSGLAGDVSLYEKEKNAVSVGVRVIPEYRRKHVASRACADMLRHAQKLGYATATAMVRKDNTPSLKLAEKLGFCIVGDGVSSQGGDVFMLEKPLRD